MNCQDSPIITQIEKSAFFYGAKLTTQLVDCDVDALEIGDDVEMVFRRVREDGEDGVISYGYKFKVIK